MKRKNRRKVNPYSDKKTFNIEAFLANSSLINYSKESYNLLKGEDLKEISITKDTSVISWLNIYGFQHSQAVRKIIADNNMDEFLINLVIDNNHRNKVIELDDCFFLTLKSPYYSSESNETMFEQMVFVVGETYVWSIQEVEGDHFQHLRERIEKNLGIIRKKGADYLFYLLMEAIIDNYYIAYDKLTEANIGLDNLNETKPTPEFALKVENNKRQLNQIKRMTISIKDAINQLENIDCFEFDIKYFIEIKEQIGLMSDEIDFNLNQLDSTLNLMFSIQNHRLNEVMKTLTIFSVIFIPLTFLAGIYGMNFKNMPELQTEYGYFILLGVMVLVSIVSIIFIKRKKWFS